MIIEQLAEELHKFYRDAFKVFAVFHLKGGHDHGWSHCNKKAYFRRRAEIMQQAGVIVTPRAWMEGMACNRFPR
jgi:hypothetical protein